MRDRHGHTVPDSEQNFDTVFDTAADRNAANPYLGELSNWIDFKFLSQVNNDKSRWFEATSTSADTPSVRAPPLRI